MWAYSRLTMQPAMFSVLSADYGAVGGEHEQGGEPVGTIITFIITKELKIQFENPKRYV